MYSFQPIADTPVDHAGMFIMSIMLFFWVVVSFFHLDEAYEWTLNILVSIILLFFTYCMSFVWTDQSPTTFKNTQVTGTFAGFVAEGYNITVQSGKTTNRVDKHEQYVVYLVEGQRVLLRAQLGSTYPEQAILYKN